MSNELVRERDGGVLVLRIDRPEASNALNPEVLEHLAEGVAEAETDPTLRVLVLTGTGPRTFCAGMDLKAFAEGAGASPEANASFVRLADGHVEVPVVAAVNGSAVGGGLEVLLGCDLAVASSQARFGLPEIRRGFIPGGSGTSLARRVPLGVALEMVLTGESIDARRALEIGLVNRVVPPADVMDAAMDQARRIAENAPLALAAGKELVRTAVSDPAGYEPRREHWRRVVFTSEDAREGAAAFVEGRPPVWKGR